MSNKTKESVADVVKEIRERLDHAAEERDFGIIEPDEMYGWADRIEAAAKRERKPRRNCDRFASRMAADFAFWRENPNLIGEEGEYKEGDELDWLFAPAEESEVAE